jgi:serine/threonine protein kinase/tetratricopeptide (TPR) repeat protein
MIGRSLNHYRILEPLGEGGMGAVYLAEDTRLGRRVALKVIPPDTADDPEELRRFRREARTVAALNHPNVVTLYSVEEAEGLHFLTMERIEGQVLGELIPRNGLTLQELFSLAVPLVDAMDAAHRHGVTHRDLKPHNVMVTPEGRVKVLDFGLARIEEHPEGEEGDALTTLVNDSGAISGTIPYMAPEQLQGEPASFPADVFSLGVILYEMATGERPFQGKTAMQLAVSILRDPPPSITSRLPAFPDELERIILRCLEKLPEDRYPQAGELLAELRRIELEWSSATLVPTTELRLPRKSRRGRWIAAGVAALAVALGGLALHLGHERPSTPGPPPPAPATAPASGPAEVADRKAIAILPFEHLGPPSERDFTAGLTEEIAHRLAMVRELSLISRTSVQRSAAATATAPEIGRRLGVGYLIEGSVRWDVGTDPSEPPKVRVTTQLVRTADDTRVWSASYDRRLSDLLGVQSEIAAAVIRELEISLLPHERRRIEEQPTDDPAAYQVFLRGRYYQGLPEYTPEVLGRAQRMFETAVELDPDFTLAHVGLTQVHSQLIHFGHDRSPARQRMALRSLERARELAPDAPEVHIAAGYYHYWARHDYETALRELARAAVDLPGDPRVLEPIAYIERRRGHLKRALAHLEKILEVDPENAQLFREIGITLSYLRRYPEALERYDQALEMAPQLAHTYLTKVLTLWLASDDPRPARPILDGLPEVHHPLADWCRYWQAVYEGDYRGAIDGLSAVEGGAIRWNVFYHPTSLLAAEAHRWLGEPEAARAGYLEARALLEAELAERPDDPRLHGALGVALAGLGEVDGAIAAGRRGVELLPVEEDAIFGPSRLIELAWILTLAGDRDGAVDVLEELLEIPAPVSPAFLRLDPRWAPLRDHPRFRELALEE